MTEALNGMPRVKGLTAASVGAGNTTINLRPDSGKIWFVLGAWAYHAAGGARNSAWYYTDPESPAGVAITPTISLAASTPLAFGALAASADSLMMGGFWCTNEAYATFLWTASGAAEDGYVRAIVLEFSGTGKLGLG